MTHIIFAEAGLPSWVETLTVAAFFMSILGNLAQYGMYRTMQKALIQKQQTEVSPQPLVVAMEKEFTTKAEFETQRKHCTERHSQLFNAVDRLAKESGGIIETKMDFARKEIVEVGKKVASLETVTELQNQKMASMDAKLDRLIERR